VRISSGAKARLTADAAFLSIWIADQTGAHPKPRSRLCKGSLWAIIPTLAEETRQMKVKHLSKHREVIPTLAAWVYDEWGHWMEPDVTPQTLAAGFERRAVEGRIPETFVAMENGEPLGTASLVAHDMAARVDLSPWLAAVYVAPEFRNRGIGSTLVGTVMDEAKALGVTDLYLFTPDRMSFYGRLGWKVLEHREHHGTEVTVMVYEF
jgi:GNAT superfamily N-acetyltransferase